MSLVNCLKYQFLHTPVEQFGDIQLVFGGAGNFVNPAELAELFAGFAEHAKNFSVEAEFVDATGKSIGGEDHGVCAGCDTYGPGRARSHATSCLGGFVADCGASVCGSGNVDCDLAKEFSF